MLIYKDMEIVKDISTHIPFITSHIIVNNFFHIHTILTIIESKN